MKRLVVLAFIGSASLGAIHASDTPAAPPADTAIKALVLQLGSDDYRERENASARLEKIGPPARDDLRRALRSESPEVRNRAAAILNRIDRAIDSARLLVAKRVKLEYTKVPLSTAVNDLKALTGLNLTLDPDRIADPLRAITCHTPELPVWDALEAFCQAANLSEVFRTELEVPKSNARRGYNLPPPRFLTAEETRIELADGPAQRLPGNRSTAVRIVALPPSFPGHTVTLGTGQVDLCLDVTPAPGTGWQFVGGVKLTRIVDSHGRVGGAGVEKIKPIPLDFAGPFAFGRGVVALRFDMGNPQNPDPQPNPRIVRVPLRLASPDARALQRLEGAVVAELQQVDQTLATVADLRGAVNTTVPGLGDVKLTILEVKEAAADQPWTIRLRLEYPSPWLQNARRRGGWNPGWPELPQDPNRDYRIAAFDAFDRPLTVAASSNYEGNLTGATDARSISLTCTRLPAKLALIGPKPVTVLVPFALENVPLP